MKKLVAVMCVAICAVSESSWGQGPLGNLLGGQGSDTLRGEVQNAVQGAVQGVPQIERTLPPNAQPNNAQVQGNVGLQGKVNNQGQQRALRSGSSLSANATAGGQFLGALRTNLNEHAVVGKDGTVRIRENLNTQMRGLGIRPNDQILDLNGQPIRDFNAASALFQSNQSIRVNRNGQILSINPIAAQTPISASSLGWGLGSRNNGVYISSLITNSLAAQAGLRAGDQIVSVNGNPVRSVNDLNVYYAQPLRGPMTISYQRNGQTGQAIFTDGSESFESSVQPPPPAYGAAGEANMPHSVLEKLDMIEQLVREIRAELSTPR